MLLVVYAKTTRLAPIVFTWLPILSVQPKRKKIASASCFNVDPFSIPEGVVKQAYIAKAIRGGKRLLCVLN